MRRPVFLPLISMLLVLGGCSLNTDYFGEYRGVNLMGNYGFDAVDANGKAKWNPASAFPFMTWESVSDSERTSEPVYRLEIRNLIPNGDFQSDTLTPENGTGLAPGWSMTNWDGKTGGPLNLRYLSTRPIVQRGLVWKAGQSGDQLRIDLNTLVPSAGWGSRMYRFRLDLINTQSNGRVDLRLMGGADGRAIEDTAENSGDWTVRTQNADGSGNTTAVYSASQSFFLRNSTDVRIVGIGAQNASGGTQEAIIDNVRLLPDDLQNLAVKASFPSLSSGVKPLLPGQKTGMYVLSIDVKNDPAAGGGNRFAAKVVTFRLEARVKSGSRELKALFQRPAGGWPAWTTLSYSFGLDFVNSDSNLGGEAALTVSISPTVNLRGDEAAGIDKNVDVGSLLVSRPNLTYNP